MAFLRLLLSYLILSVGYHLVFSETDPGDAAALRSLRDQWRNTPPSWRNSDDPCGASWEGVACSNSRVNALVLSTMGLSGQLSSDIGRLTELIQLDLSYNEGLTGSLPSHLGDLQKLNTLMIDGCNFTGNIPSELGNLAELSFLALNGNKLTGEIPSSLGNLNNLYWLDLADNQLTGSIPVSTSSTPGLDLLKNAKHFHLNKNQLSGAIPEKLFTSDMVLVHILFNDNHLTGEIPASLGLVQTLEVLRLDRNALNGLVLNLNILSNLHELNLANNNFSGPLPDLTGMNYLNFVDLSNNSFQQLQAPAWFSTLQSLNTLVLEYGPLEGLIPQELFSLPQIQVVKLRNNAFNDTLNIGSNISLLLQFVDLQNNEISSLIIPSGFNNTLILIGNPVCSASLTNTSFCQLNQSTASLIRA